MRPIRTVVAVLAVVASTMPASAFHDPGLPVLAEADLVNGGWARFELEAQEGATLDVEVEAEFDDAGTAYIADWLLLEGGSGSSLLRASGGEGTRIVTPVTGVAYEEESTTFSGGVGSAGTYFGLPAGPMTVIVAAATDSGTMDGDLTIAGDGIEVVSSNSGGGVVAAGAEGFDPALHVRGPGGLVEVAADGSVGIETDVPLFAWFVANHDVASVRYDGPARSETALSPLSFAWVVLNGEPAGAHTFTLEAAAGAVFTGWDLLAVPVG